MANGSFFDLFRRLRWWLGAFQSAPQETRTIFTDATERVEYANASEVLSATDAGEKTIYEQV